MVVMKTADDRRRTAALSIQEEHRAKTRQQRYEAFGVRTDTPVRGVSMQQDSLCPHCGKYDLVVDFRAETFMCSGCGSRGNLKIGWVQDSVPAQPIDLDAAVIPIDLVMNRAVSDSAVRLYLVMTKWRDGLTGKVVVTAYDMSVALRSSVLSVVRMVRELHEAGWVQYEEVEPGAPGAYWLRSISPDRF